MPGHDDFERRRRSPRLRGYDYTQSGAYFVTICTQGRIPCFGQIIDQAMRLSQAGQMVQATWDELPRHYPGIDLDAFVVMPDHVHGIIVLSDQADRLSLPDAMQRFKSLTTARYRHGVSDGGWVPFPGRLWQRSYYDHIIRGEADLHRIRAYVEENPARWLVRRARMH
jgi:REP-associated tyrosine transposase